LRKVVRKPQCLSGNLLWFTPLRAGPERCPRHVAVEAGHLHRVRKSVALQVPVCSVRGAKTFPVSATVIVQMVEREKVHVGFSATPALEFTRTVDSERF
jgi:hypothetical protein